MTLINIATNGAAQRDVQQRDANCSTQSGGNTDVGCIGREVCVFQRLDRNCTPGDHLGRGVTAGAVDVSGDGILNVVVDVNTTTAYSD